MKFNPALKFIIMLPFVLQDWARAQDPNLSIASHSNAVAISFESEVGTHYTLETSTNLSDHSWAGRSALIPGDGDSKTVEYPMEDDGSKFYRLVPVQAIPGTTEVTHAVEATGAGTRYDVGPDQSNADLTTIPWRTLGPGDVVNIFYRATPYSSKVVLSEKGTALDRIIINGVTDASGNRPVISAAESVAVNDADWHPILAPLSIWILGQNHETGVYGVDYPAYITIQNLKFTGCRAGVAYSGPGTEIYQSGASAIRLQQAWYTEILGCEFVDNDQGLFISGGEYTENGARLNRATRVAGCSFMENGVLGSYRHHHLYYQGITGPGEESIIEGNYFGALTTTTPATAAGGAIKCRAMSPVIRYNKIVAVDGTRAIDLVEAQDGVPQWMYANCTPQEILDRYRTAYVYGNEIITDFDIGSVHASWPIHVGMDTTEGGDDPQTFHESQGPIADVEPMARGYQSPVYFYHNSFWFRATIWRAGLFDLDANAASSHPGKIVVMNNIFSYAGSTRIAQARHTGEVEYQAANLFNTATLPGFYESEYNANNEILGDDQDPVTETTITTNSFGVEGDPQFSNPDSLTIAQKDLTLTSGSPAIDLARPLSDAVYSHPVFLQPNLIGGGASVRATTDDVGSQEFAP